MSRETLQDWVNKQLVAPTIENAPEKKVALFSLVHVNGNREIEIKSIMIGSKQWEAEELADMFDTVAETHAGGIPGIQQFNLLCFYEGQKKPSTYYPFRKQGEAESYGLGSEAPTTTGHAQQMMRHNEAMYRVGTQHSESLHDRMLGLIDKQMSMMNEDRVMIREMRKSEHDTIELAKELIMKTAADEHAHKIELLKMEQSRETRTQMTRLLPAVANTLTGREIFPQAVADTAILDDISESLDIDQIQKLQGILKPAQMALLAPRIKLALEKQAAKEKAKADAAE